MNNPKIWLLSMVLISACNGGQQTESIQENSPIPKSQVIVTHVRKGNVADNLELFASTFYLKRNVVTAPIPSFITKVNVRLGDKVKKGQVLYELESKERRALGNNDLRLDSAISGFGLIQVKAQASGIVSTLDKQQTGDYILEGTLLCTIAESGDLAFQVNVPYEFNHYTHPGKQCQIILPDNSVHAATITTPLTAMNALAQTQTMLAKPASSLYLPEGLIVKVIVSKSDENPRQVVPKSAVQSDEMLKNFWVMKLINDSTAVKVPVTVGNTSRTEAELLSPQFSKTDKIISLGAYGLSDTALVKIDSLK